MQQISIGLWQINMFIRHSSELFSMLENKLVGYCDESTLITVVPSPGVRVTVAESMIRDLGCVSGWCDLWGMELNASKTKTVIVSRSSTMHPHSPPLSIGGTAEGVWWPWYIEGDIWFQNDLWEASSLGFQSSFSKSWFVEEVMASIPS